MEHNQTTTLDQAADWYHQLREPGVSADLFLDWQKWLSQNNANIKAFEKVEELMQLSGQIEEIAWPNEQELLADEYDGEIPVADWQRQQQHLLQPRHATRRPSWCGIGALNRQPRRILIGVTLSFIAVISLGIMLNSWQMNPQTGGVLNVAVQETPAAEHREVTLSDGSLITLGAKSLISVAYSAKQRRVILVRGEAYFDVKKNPQWPFVVSSGNRTITAVGTAFNVTRRKEQVVVTVEEGSVIVAEDTETAPVIDPKTTIPVNKAKLSPTTRLEAGQQIAYDSHEVITVAVTDPDVATTWRQGRRRYLGEKLRYVIADVNRYSKHPIRLGDEVVAELSFTGTVFQDNIDSWLVSIEEAFPIDVAKQPGGAVILLSRKSD